MKCPECGEENPAEIHTCSPQVELCPNCGDADVGNGALRNDADELVCGYKYCFNCAHTWDIS